MRRTDAQPVRVPGIGGPDDNGFGLQGRYLGAIWLPTLVVGVVMVLSTIIEMNVRMGDDHELRGYSIVFGLFAGALAAGLVAVGLVAQWALLVGRAPALGVRLASSAAAVVISVGAQAAILTAFSRGPSLWPSFGLAAIAGIAAAVVSTLRVHRSQGDAASDGSERA